MPSLSHAISMGYMIENASAVMATSETECKSRFTFNVSSLLAPFISFGLLTIFSLFTWLMFTTHSQAEELAKLQTDSKLLEHGLNQIAKNTGNISNLEKEFSAFRTETNEQFGEIDERFEIYDLYFETILNWIKVQPTQPEN